jgi:deoxyribonuclease-4
MVVFVGAHISKTNSFEGKIDIIKKGEGNAMQIFTGNPRSLHIADYKKYIPLLKNIEDDFSIVIHCAYTINLASLLNNGKRVYENTQDTPWFKNLMEDLKIANEANIVGCVVHVGKHTTQTYEEGLKTMKNNVACVINNMIDRNYTNTKLLIETSCGAGTELIYDIDKLIDFYNSFTYKEKQYLGICFDTCHVFSAGYDITESYQKIQKYTKNAITVIHLNNSKNPFGSHKDRHDIIDNGHINKYEFETLLSKITDNTTIILETPDLSSEEKFKRDIEFVKNNT